MPVATRSSPVHNRESAYSASAERFDPAEAADLRRRRQRALTETLLERAEHLPQDDRALLESVYREGAPVSGLAELLNTSARSLRRRVRRLVQRVLSEQYVFVARRRVEWSPTRRRVAEACVLGGRSLREAAADLKLSLHAVRRHADAVHAMYEAERDARRSASNAAGART